MPTSQSLSPSLHPSGGVPLSLRVRAVEAVGLLQHLCSLPRGSQASATSDTMARDVERMEEMVEVGLFVSEQINAHLI